MQVCYCLNLGSDLDSDLSYYLSLNSCSDLISDSDSGLDSISDSTLVFKFRISGLERGLVESQIKINSGIHIQIQLQFPIQV